MSQAQILSKTSCCFCWDTSEERALQNCLDRLSLKKISWEKFKEKVVDPLAMARLTSSKNKRTLLHLAVLDDRVDIVQLLKKDPVLKLRRDGFGLSPLDMAHLLNRKEILQLFQPLVETPEELPYPIFETQEDFEKVLACVAKAKQEDRIPSEKLWMGSYFDQEIRKGSHPLVSIEKVNEEVGFGVFADAKIPACSYVGEYTGVICQRKPRHLKKKRHCLRYTVWGSKENFTIDAEEKGNFTRFINHSADPNLGVQSVYWSGIPRMIFISLKEIPKGKQLTFDYGPLFWKNHPQSPHAF